MENYLSTITNYLLTQSWQIAALVAVIAAINLALKNRSAHVRYLLWLIVLAKCLVPPLLTVPLAVLPEERPAVVVTMLDRSVAEPPVRPVTPVVVAQAPTIVERPARFNSRQWLVFGWVMGVAAFVIFAVIKALRTNFWLWRQRKQLPAEPQTEIEDLFSGLGIKTLPKVWLVDGIGQPFVWGLLRGSIYLPADFVKVNSSEHRRGVLGHELGHILRFDAAVNILQIISQAVFWFHPFVWWANKRIRAEREKCCDEMSIARLGAKAKDYSDAIVNILISEHKSTRPVPSLAVAGPVKNIEERIKTMLRPGKKFYKRPSLIAVLAVLLLALLTVPTVLVLTARAETKVKEPDVVADSISEEDPDSSKRSESGKKVTYTGIVVNAEGKPVAGASVRLYEARIMREEVTTKTDGSFYLRVGGQVSGDRTKYGAIVARKKGIAIGCAYWDMTQDEEVVIKLGEPKALNGLVVDERGEPIGGVQVRIWQLVVGEVPNDRWLDNEITEKMFNVRTDSTGKFSFPDLPADATADVVIRKAERATVSTQAVAPGQKDLRITMPLEARVEGVVKEKGTGQPIAGVELFVIHERPPWIGTRYRPVPWHEPVTSRKDGTFSISALSPGEYILQVTTPEWVAEPVKVTTEVGKTKAEVRVEVSKGGILEIVITDAATEKPIENARVDVRHAESGQRFRAESDKQGIARIRLNPGQYYRGIRIYKQGYRLWSRREPVLIEDGKTERIEWSLATRLKIKGVVLDQAGKPVNRAKVAIAKAGVGGPVTATDADTQGRFQITWDPGKPAARKVHYLVARDVEQNLVAAVEIDEDSEILNVKLKPGVVLAGKVVGPNGKPIFAAEIALTLVAFNWGSSFIGERVKTDVQGNFELRALPLMLPDVTWSLTADAEGYGPKRVAIHTDSVVNNHLSLEPVVLPVANLSVSGIVVDSNDKPVPGAKIEAAGKRILYRQTRTNGAGKFIVNGICEGPVTVLASTEGKTRLFGRVNTEAGALYVKIVVTEDRRADARYVPKQTPSLVGKPLRELKDLQIELSPDDVSNRMILVCFFDIDQRPSRYFITELAKQAKQLKEKSITVVAVQASKVDERALNEWVQKYSIPFLVGMVQGDVEKAKFAWGVRALPWLILTDRQHVISAEGFEPDRLDEKIKAVAER